MDIAFSDLDEDLPIVEEDDSWFYEHIDAPKFVDFTAPDSPPVDDISWFCLRCGCDQQHEEFELDPEALHRDFMLRVMAARSPNVKLRRSLDKLHQSPGSIKKCPHSAPAKSVEGRTGGTNFVSSIPNYPNSKLKTHPISSLKSTPSTKEKKKKTLISEKKGLMSPGSKGLPAKRVSSKSAKIGNGKVESLNHKDAAKASRRSSSIGKQGDICDAMKKLSIDSIKQNKKSMTMKKNIGAVSVQGDVCKAISKVAVKPSRSAKLGNRKVESLKQNDVAKASRRSSGTSKQGDICDAMKKPSIDSIKQNKKSKTMKKNIGAVSVQGDVCKAISKVGVKPSRSAKLNGKVESLKRNNVAKASRISKSISKQGDICDAMKKPSIDSIKQNKKSMAMKKNIGAVSIQGVVCKAISKVGVKPSRSAKLGNGKVESLKQNDAAKASPTSSSTNKYADICDGMKKLSIDSIKKNKKCMSVKKKTEVVSVQGQVCKTISKLGVEHGFADDLVPIILKESNHSDITEEFLKVNEVVPQISKLDNSAEFDDDKENACTTRKISTTNSESCENSQQKVHMSVLENKAPVKKIKEATLNGKVKRSTAPKPFRLRTDERRIVKEANIERRIQVKSQKENLIASRHGEIKNKYANSVKTHKNTLEGPRDNTSKYVIDGKNHRRPKDSKHERAIVKEANTKSNIQHKTQKKVPVPLKYNGDVKNQNGIQGKSCKTTLEAPKAKPNLPKAPRVRYVESRFGKASPSIHKVIYSSYSKKRRKLKLYKTKSSRQARIFQIHKEFQM